MSPIAMHTEYDSDNDYLWRWRRRRRWWWWWRGRWRRYVVVRGMGVNLGSLLCIPMPDLARNVRWFAFFFSFCCSENQSRWTNAEPNIFTNETFYLRRLRRLWNMSNRGSRPLKRPNRGTKTFRNINLFYKERSAAKPLPEVCECVCVKSYNKKSERNSRKWNRNFELKTN